MQQNVGCVPVKSVRECNWDQFREAATTDWGQIEEIVRDGTIVNIREGLQDTGFFEQFRDIALQAITDICGRTVGDMVSKNGLEYLHKFVNTWQIPHLVSLLIVRYSALATPFLRALMMNKRSMMPVFSAAQAWVRIMIPNDQVEDCRELFSGQWGHTIPHNPHRDSWFSQPLNTVNIWIAVGSVRAGNSVLLYPMVFGKDLRRFQSTIEWNEDVGHPMPAVLMRGDVLLFSGEHLHSSEVNTTPMTRFVVSFRMTIGEPAFGSSQEKTPYVQI